MTAATPLRSTELSLPLRDDATSDPVAARLMELVQDAEDVSSWSDELALVAGAWPDAYHLHPSRANVLRAVPVPVDARVLELGARAGGLTRYLGEQAALVDALELDPALAAVAAARCADLDGVQVCVGWLDAVPDQVAYDLVVAVDVVPDLDDHDMIMEDFVMRCQRLLKPGGVLVLAADNSASLSTALGGRHRPLPVSGGSPAVIRVAEVEAAVAAAGMQSTTLSVFPDHRHAQIVFSHQRLAQLGDGLLTHLPKFAVPPTGPTYADPVAQQRRWALMVAEGTAEGRANSVMVVAGAPAPALDDVAIFWSVGRSAAHSACNRVRYEDHRPVVVRGRAFPDAPRTDDPLRLCPHTEAVVDGVSITDLLLTETDLRRTHEILSQWARLVRSHDDRTVPWDLIPRNVLVRPDDSMEAIDQEWELDGCTADDVLARGCFWLAQELVSASPRPAWLPSGTVGRVAQHLRRLSGAEDDLFWLEKFFEREADQSAYAFPVRPPNSHASQSHKNRGDLMALSQSGDSRHVPSEDASSAGADSATVLHAMIASLGDENDALRAHVRALELQQRRAALVHRDHTMGLVAESELVQDHLARVQRESRRHKERAVKLQKQVMAIKSSTTWRIGRFFIRPFAAITGRGR
jgi:SAM-dependent methyltransferase